MTLYSIVTNDVELEAKNALYGGNCSVCHQPLDWIPFGIEWKAVCCATAHVLVPTRVKARVYAVKNI